jgi:RNA polymerase sigma-70 factor (ECF subfamily)
LDEAVKREKMLIRRAKEGDLRSFSLLVDIYQERAIHAAYSFLGDFEDARDMAQEAFVKAYEKLGDFRGRSKFYTWFYRILMNLCKDFLRKKRIKTFFSGFGNGLGENRGSLGHAISNDKNSYEALEARELGMEIHKALNKLPFKQRTAFILRYLEGLSIEDVAQSMELTKGAVKAHLWQSVQKMRKFLDRYVKHGESAP